MAGPSDEFDTGSAPPHLRHTEVLVAGVKATVPLSRSDALVAGFIVLDADRAAELGSPNDAAPVDRSDDAVADWLRNLSRDCWTRKDTSQAKTVQELSRAQPSQTVGSYTRARPAVTLVIAPAPPSLVREGVGSPTSASIQQSFGQPVQLSPAPAPPRFSALIGLAEAERNVISVDRLPGSARASVPVVTEAAPPILEPAFPIKNQDPFARISAPSIFGSGESSPGSASLFAPPAQQTSQIPDPSVSSAVTSLFGVPGVGPVTPGLIAPPPTEALPPVPTFPRFASVHSSPVPALKVEPGSTVARTPSLEPTPAISPAPPLRDEQPEALTPTVLPTDPAPGGILSPSATPTAELLNRIAAASPPLIKLGNRNDAVAQGGVNDANDEALYVGWRADVGETASNSFRLSQQTYDAVTAPQQSSLNPVIHATPTPSWAHPLPPIAIDAPTVVSAVNLKKEFRSNKKIVSALSDVSLCIASGEFVVITGPSGSGKTTLLNCLAGFDNADSGQIVIDGYDVALLSDGERTRHRSSAMGFVFQSYNLLGVLSAVENVEVPLLLNGWSPTEARDEALAALTMVGMANRADHLPDDLSGGEQQRVTIARALVGEPRLLWADEPTGNLDPESTEGIMHLLRELNADGLTIVMVTHDRSIALLAHRRLELRNGQLVETEVHAGATRAAFVTTSSTVDPAVGVPVGLPTGGVLTPTRP